MDRGRGRCDGRRRTREGTPLPPPPLMPETAQMMGMMRDMLGVMQATQQQVQAQQQMMLQQQQTQLLQQILNVPRAEAPVANAPAVNQDLPTKVPEFKRLVEEFYGDKSDPTAAESWRRPSVFVRYQKSRS